MIVIGIDPGKSGALVSMDSESGEVLSKSITPMVRVGKSRQEYDIPGMRKLLYDASSGSCRVFIERQQARPGQGVSSMFTIGLGYGLWLGICGGLQMPIEVVSPTSWTKEMLRGVPGDGKGRNILAAKRLFPDVDLRKSDRARVDHDGICDALLICEFGRRLNQ